jgi:glycopeptide antibiotics resistance protein
MRKKVAKGIKVLVVLIPVLFVLSVGLLRRYGVNFLDDQQSALNALLNTFPLLIFVLIDAVKRNQSSAHLMLVHASFYVYVYGVLALTILYVPFFEMITTVFTYNLGQWSAHLSYILDDPANRYFNLTILQKFVRYDLVHHQVIGNMIMLFPLGLYLPLLFKKINSFFKVLGASFLVSLSIESLQFIITFLTPESPYFRTFDVDDLLLNTAGAAAGYICFLLITKTFRGRRI